jgi:hypothetical protein
MEAIAENKVVADSVVAEPGKVITSVVPLATPSSPVPTTVKVIVLSSAKVVIEMFLAPPLWVEANSVAAKVHVVVGLATVTQ